MPIPPFHEIESDIVQFLRDKGGQASRSGLVTHLAVKYILTQEELLQKDPGGRLHFQKQVDGAIHWLKEDGIIVHASYGYWRLAT